MEELKELCSNLFDADYFFTGSREYGIKVSSDSDYDICFVFSEQLNTKLNQFIISHNLSKTDSNYNKGFYIIYKDKQLNFIPLSRVIFDIWKNCTDTIKGACTESSVLRDLLQNKNNRLAFFELLKGYFRIAQNEREIKI